MPESGQRLYYGWWVTGVCFVDVAARRGSETAYSVLLVALVAEFGWERGTIAGAFALSMLIAECCAPAAGWLLDRYPPRLGMSLGGTALGLTALALAGVQTPWQLYVIMAVLYAPALALLNLGSLSAYLARWFVRRRAFAIGLSQAGQGGGIFILTPLIGWLILTMGWRLGYLVLGVGLLALLLPLNLIVPRRNPQQLGLEPDGEAARGQGISQSSDFAPGTWTLAQARRTRTFWMLLLSFYCFPTANQVFFIHLVPHLTDIGLTPSTAAWIFAVAGLVSIPGRLLFGVLTDRCGGIVATQLSLGLSILAVIFVLLPPSLWLLYVFALVFGLSLGSRGVSLGALTADTFPGPEFGVIYGWITSGQLIGGAFGPWLAGLVFDHMGSYRLVFYGCIVGFAISLIFVAMAAWSRKRLERIQTA